MMMSRQVKSLPASSIEFPPIVIA